MYAIVHCELRALSCSIAASGSFGRAAWCIEAEERIDPVVVNARLRGDHYGLRVVALAKAAHPNVAILLMSADERETFLNLPHDHSLIQVLFGVEVVLKHVDDAFVRRHESLDRA